MSHPGVLCCLTYSIAAVAAFAVGYPLAGAHPLVVVAAADIAATIVVFLVSRAHDNSSLYDPYWSVAPPFIVAYLTLHPVAVGATLSRQLLVGVLVTAWALRLTYNWYRGWRGLEHEDWRYVDIRQRAGDAYWPASFLGIHMFPTAMVYAGCLPLYAALTSTAPLGWLDAAAVAVTAGAIGIEAVADQQLHRFVSTNTERGRILTDGLWAYCRHPNYFGETSFWWGLFLFGLAADPDAAWTVVGALAITLMFRFVSIPLLDARSVERRPGYVGHMRRVSALIPWPSR